MANTFLTSNFSHGASVDDNRGSNVGATGSGGFQPWGGLGITSVLSYGIANGVLTLTFPASQGSTTTAITGAVERIRSLMAALRANKGSRFDKFQIKFSGGN